jgi:hypothetical protein
MNSTLVKPQSAFKNTAVIFSKTTFARAIEFLHRSKMQEICGFLRDVLDSRRTRGYDGIIQSALKT